MTDSPPIPTSIPDDNIWLARYEQERACQAELLMANKLRIFDALAAAGIETVTVVFDGYGDSGQIEDIESEPAALPAISIDFAQRVADRLEVRIELRPMPLREAIETMAYALLGDTHGGWDNNDGAYGDFILNVAERGITLNYNARYTESEYSQHAF